MLCGLNVLYKQVDILLCVMQINCAIQNKTKYSSRKYNRNSKIVSDAFSKVYENALFVNADYDTPCSMEKIIDCDAVVIVNNSLSKYNECELYIAKKFNKKVYRFGRDILSVYLKEIKYDKEDPE